MDRPTPATAPTVFTRWRLDQFANKNLFLLLLSGLLVALLATLSGILLLLPGLLILLAVLVLLTALIWIAHLIASLGCLTHVIKRWPRA